MSVDNVQDLTPRVRYIAGASQTDFDYPFPIFADADLVVYVDDVLQTLATDYTVSGEGEDNGGTVTLIALPAGGEVVTIYRDIPIERNSDFQTNGRFSSASLNDEFDRATMVDQQLETQIERCIRLPFTAAATASQTLLSPIDNWLGKFIRLNDVTGIPEPADFDGSGTPLSQSVIAAYLNPLTEFENTAGVTPTDLRYIEGHARRYGATGTDSGNDAIAIQAAIDVAYAGSGAVYLDAGVYRCASDVQIRKGVHIFGAGVFRTHLHFVGATLSASAAVQGERLDRWAVENLQISRTGSVGPAFTIVGSSGGGGSDVVRYCVNNMYISESTGVGIDLRSSYLAKFEDLFIHNTDSYGLLIEAASGIGGNALTFVGGEIQNCEGGVFIGLCQAVSFLGTTIEGNFTLGGVELSDSCFQVKLDNCYFENNDAFDIRIGNAANTGRGFRIVNCTLTDAGAAKDSSIILVRGDAIKISQCRFINYAVEAIEFAPASGGAVKGRFDQCAHTGSVTVVCTTTDKFFHQLEDDAQLVGTSGSTNPASVADGDDLTGTLTVTGAAVGDSVQVFASIALVDTAKHMGLSGYVSAADTVTWVMQNNSGGAIDLAALTITAIVHPKALYQN